MGLILVKQPDGNFSVLEDGIFTYIDASEWQATKFFVERAAEIARAQAQEQLRLIRRNTKLSLSWDEALQSHHTYRNQCEAEWNQQVAKLAAEQTKK
jgi:hypothetical protein